jgi:hypothetical protein
MSDIQENIVESIGSVEPTLVVAEPTVITADATPAPVEVVENTVLNTDVVQPETKRGPGRPRTKMTMKRVVLLNGQPVGRGRPAKDGKGDRTVVYIPVDETFDVSKHGVGKKFYAGVKAGPSIKRVDFKKFDKLVKVTG